MEYREENIDYKEEYQKVLERAKKKYEMTASENVKLILRDIFGEKTLLPFSQRVEDVNYLHSVMLAGLTLLQKSKSKLYKTIDCNAIRYNLNEMVNLCLTHIEELKLYEKT